MIKIRIKSLKINNFLSYKDTELNLINSPNQEPTLTIISGINLDNDTDSSNGSGKSSLISESLFFNIYGKPLRAKKINDLIRHSTDKMSNEIKYYVNDNDILTISRIKTLKSGTTNITLNGSNVSKRTKALSDKDIVQFIDLLPDSFSQAILYYPDNDNLFSLSYSQRLDYFKKLINLQCIDDLYEKIRKFKSSNETKLFEINTTINSTKEIVNIVEDNKDEYIQYLNNNIDTLNNKLQESNNIKVADNTEYNNILKELNQLLIDYQKEYDTAHKDLLSKKSDIEKIEREISRYNKLSGIHCPTCNQIVSNEYVGSIVNEYNNQLEKLKTDLTYRYELETDINNDIKDTRTNIEKIKDKISDIDTQRRNKENQIRLVENQLYSAKRDLDKAVTEKNKSDSNKIDKNKYELKLTGFQNALAIRNNWQKALEYWYNILSPKSILRSSLLRKYIGILSDLFGYYLTKLFTDDIISSIEIDDMGNIDTNIIHNGFEIGYWNMSSGERRRISIAIQLAMFKFVKTINDNCPEFIILDEPFDNLDIDGINSVTKVLNEFMIDNKIDCYIISHIAIPLEHIHNVKVQNILVEKKDNISSARMV